MDGGKLVRRTLMLTRVTEPILPSAASLAYLNSRKITEVFEYWRLQGIPLLIKDLLSVAFSNDGIFMSVRQSEGSIIHVWKQLPESLNNYLTEIESIGVRSVSIGVNDSWVVVLNDGTYGCMGIVDDLKLALTTETPAVSCLLINFIVSLSNIWDSRLF
jgi:hypothetical protein